MATMELDRELVLAVPFMLGSLVTLGMLAPTSLEHIDLSMVLYSGVGMDLQIAHALQIGSLGGIIINREGGISGFIEQARGLSIIEGWVLYATIGLVLAPPFLPEVAGTLAHQPIAYATFALQTIGFGLVSYIN